MCPPDSVRGTEWRGVPEGTEWREMDLFMRFPGGRAKALTLSYDDGVIQDEKLLALFKKHGLKATLNISSGCYADKDYDDYSSTHRRMTKERAQKLYIGSGFEIASHSVTHAFLEQLDPLTASYEILNDKADLEKDYQCFVRGFAYPYGRYNATVKEILKNAGIKYARGVWETHDFGIPTDWLELRPTCHHADPMLPELTDRFINEKPWQGPRLFYLWGHSYEFDFQNNWEIIENFADKISGRDDIWYATNIEVYDYVDAYKRLVFNADMSRVYNPSAADIWFSWGGKDYCVKGGETLSL